MSAFKRDKCHVASCFPSAGTCASQVQKTPNKNLRSYIQGRIFFKLPVLYYTVDL